MKYRHLLAASLFITSGSLFANQTDKRPLPYQNPKLSVDERVEDLIKRMTLEEKVYQMSALRLGEGDRDIRDKRQLFHGRHSSKIRKTRSGLLELPHYGYACPQSGHHRKPNTKDCGGRDPFGNTRHD